MSKMIKCKTCGSEIANNAKFCPSCGGKNKTLHPIRGLLAGCAAALFAFVLIPMIMGQSSNTEAAKETPRPAYKITAQDLQSAYADNKVNADNLYKDKIIAVVGTVSDVTQDIVTREPCVTLDTGNAFGLYAIQCFFKDDDSGNASVAELRNGQSVTIIGDCDGARLSNVQLYNCYIYE